MKINPASGELCFTEPERAAYQQLPEVIVGAQAFETFIEVAQAVVELRQLGSQGQMSPDIAQKNLGRTYNQNAIVLGKTATELFNHAVENWPIYNKS